MTVSILALLISVCSLLISMRREAPHFNFFVSEELSDSCDFEEYALSIANVGGGDAYAIAIRGLGLEFDTADIVCIHPGESVVIHFRRRIAYTGEWAMPDRIMRPIQVEYPAITLRWRTRFLTLSGHHVELKPCELPRQAMPREECGYFPNMLNVG